MSIYHSNRRLYLPDILGRPLTRSNINMRLSANWEAWLLFQSFPEEVRQRIYLFLEGRQGLLLPYPLLFLRIFHPEAHSRRLGQFLSAIIEQTVTVEYGLPGTAGQLSGADGHTTPDLAVRLSDGGIATVEIQLPGCGSAGERSCCHLSEMILREYVLARQERGARFSYQNMKPVYLLLFVEQGDAFPDDTDIYIHHGRITYDSGLALESLENIFLISLDTYRRISQNKDISTIQDAWLTFLCYDTPDKIYELVTRFPEFHSIYREIAEFRRHPEELIFLFSEALQFSEYPFGKS